jgi:hypothetical protein
MKIDTNRARLHKAINNHTHGVALVVMSGFVVLCYLTINIAVLLAIPKTALFFYMVGTLFVYTMHFVGGSELMYLQYKFKGRRVSYGIYAGIKLLLAPLWPLVFLSGFLIAVVKYFKKPE